MTEPAPVTVARLSAVHAALALVMSVEAAAGLVVSIQIGEPTLDAIRASVIAGAIFGGVMIGVLLVSIMVRGWRFGRLPEDATVVSLGAVYGRRWLLLGVAIPLVFALTPAQIAALSGMGWGGAATAVLVWAGGTIRERRQGCELYVSVGHGFRRKARFFVRASLHGPLKLAS